MLSLLATLIAVPSAHAAGRADGAFLNQITNAYVTPHLDWAKPLAGGAPKVLFIVPRKSAREVVELSERTDLDPQSVVSYNSVALAIDSIYESLVTGTSANEKARELSKKLDNHYDAVVLANVDMKALPIEAQYRILQQVSDGAGLLLTYPRALANPKILSVPNDDWKQIVQMTDVAALPGDAANLTADKLIKTYRFGKGRIATLNYPVTSASVGGGLALTAYADYSPDWKAHYENNMALAARTVQWAAGRDISAVVIPAWPKEIHAAQKVLLPLQVKNVTNGKVLLRLRDSWNSTQWKGSVAIQNGKASAVQLPAMEAGAHFLDVRLEQNGAIQSFGVFHCDVTSPTGNITIITSKESYEHGQNVAGKVLLQHALDHDANLQLRLEDLPSRKIWQEQTLAIKRGMKEINFIFPNVKLATVAGTVVAQIWQNGKPIIKNEQIAFFPRRHREIFPTLLWDTVPPYLTEMYAGQLIDNMHDPAGLTHPKGDGSMARLTALVNQRFVPYVTRIGLSAGDKGQTLNNHWLSMTKEEVEKATAGDGSIYNPAVRALWKENIARRINGVPRVGPMVYSLGDENNFSYDAGYSPADTVEYRKFLQRSYGTIEKLNQEWSAHFTSFDAVPNYSPQELRDKRLFPAWNDHRSFIEKEYADVHHFLSQTIKEIDPHALVGAEGSQPGNLEQTIDDLEFWGPYSNAVNDELLRSIGPEKLRMLWWGYGPTTVGDGLPYALWRPLLQGTVNGSAWYSSGIESMGLLSVDLSFAKYFQKLRPSLNALEDGQAQVLIKTPLRKDNIAIFWSHDSYSASFMDDRFFKPTDSAGALMNFCYRQGLNFDYVTSKMAKAGELKNYKVLFLLGASALSEADQKAIKDFADRGGIVIADINPGILNGYLRPLERSSLADFFAAPQLNWQPNLEMKPVKINATVRKKHFSFSATKAFQSPEVPVFTSHETGKGLSILLNFNLGTAQNTATSPQEFDAFLLNLLSLGNIKPPIHVHGLSTDHLVVRVRQNSENQVIGVLANKEDIGKTMTLDLPKAGWIYEVNRGLLSHAAKLAVKVDTPFKVYCVFPSKQVAPKFKLDKSRVSRGHTVHMDLSQLQKQGIYRVEVVAPNGQILKRSVSVFTSQMPGSVSEIPFAYNDLPGRYQIRLTDVRTGLQTTHAMILQ